MHTACIPESPNVITDVFSGDRIMLKSLPYFSWHPRLASTFAHVEKLYPRTDFRPRGSPVRRFFFPPLSQLLHEPVDLLIGPLSVILTLHVPTIHVPCLLRRFRQTARLADCLVPIELLLYHLLSPVAVRASSGFVDHLPDDFRGDNFSCLQLGVDAVDPLPVPLFLCLHLCLHQRPACRLQLLFALTRVPPRHQRQEDGL